MVLGGRPASSVGAKPLALIPDDAARHAAPAFPLFRRRYGIEHNPDSRVSDGASDDFLISLVALFGPCQPRKRNRLSPIRRVACDLSIAGAELRAQKVV